jgi:hypothetical protein
VTLDSHDHRVLDLLHRPDVRVWPHEHVFELRQLRVPATISEEQRGIVSSSEQKHSAAARRVLQ